MTVPLPMSTAVFCEAVHACTNAIAYHAPEIQRPPQSTSWQCQVIWLHRTKAFMFGRLRGLSTEPSAAILDRIHTASSKKTRRLSSKLSVGILGTSRDSIYATFTKKTRRLSSKLSVGILGTSRDSIYATFTKKSADNPQPFLDVKLPSADASVRFPGCGAIFTLKRS